MHGRFESGEEIAALRRFVGPLQVVLARTIEVRVYTLRNWGQGRRRPEEPAIVLPKIAARHSWVIRESLRIAARAMSHRREHCAGTASGPTQSSRTKRLRPCTVGACGSSRPTRPASNWRGSGLMAEADDLAPRGPSRPGTAARSSLAAPPSVGKEMLALISLRKARGARSPVGAHAPLPAPTSLRLGREAHERRAESLPARPVRRSTAPLQSRSTACAMGSMRR